MCICSIFYSSAFAYKIQVKTEPEKVWKIAHFCIDRIGWSFWFHHSNGIFSLEYYFDTTLEIIQPQRGLCVLPEFGKKVDNHSGWLSGFAINKSDSLRAGLEEGIPVCGMRLLSKIYSRYFYWSKGKNPGFTSPPPRRLTL